LDVQPVSGEADAFDLAVPDLARARRAASMSGALGATDDAASFGRGTERGQPRRRRRVALYRAMQPALEELAGEVRRSLEFHLGRYPDTTFGRILLVGGGAKLRNLDVFLTQMMGVPASVCDPFAFVALQQSKLKRMRSMVKARCARWRWDWRCAILSSKTMARRDKSAQWFG
jgi:hypothetical protein